MFPGGKVSKITLDDENGVLVYSVEIGTSDVKVDAKTGIVIRIDNGSDVKEKGEVEGAEVEKAEGGPKAEATANK